MKNFLLQQRQFLLYCLIGLSGVSLDLGVYLLLVKTKAINLDYQVANAIGYASGMLLSFVLNARFNFRVADKIALRLAIFFSVAARLVAVCRPVATSRRPLRSGQGYFQADHHPRGFVVAI